MRIHNIQSTTAFQRALTKEELPDYKKTLAEARKIVKQTGKSIFIMPSFCLPQSKELNTGVGHIAAPKSQEFFDYMHNYLGFNIVEDLPAGQIRTPKSGFYCAYTSSALALGNHQICPELLTTNEYSNLLTKAELKEIVDNNYIPEKEYQVNFKNVMEADGAQNKMLKKAYERFQKLDNQTLLKQNYQKFINENNDWLSFPRTNEPNQEFFKFKQFLANEHLKKGKEMLNAKGIRLAGDCLIGFSKDEVQAYPKAFKQNHNIGLPSWGLPALNYDTILDESSEAAKLLKRKIQLNAQRYDIIRFDVGWAYITPVITPFGENRILEKNRKYLNEDLLKLIEKWVLEVKGKDFDLKNLIYEFDAGADEFQAFEGKDLIKPLQNRVRIYGNTYMHNKDGDAWGYNKAFLDRGWNPDYYILGVGNHDPQPLRQIANDQPEFVQKFDERINQYILTEARHKEDAIKPLSEELKIKPETLQNPVEFAKAKFAEPMMSKNNQYFYMDVFGRSERFDMQGLNLIMHPEKNFARKIPENFAEAYHASLKEGFGFNIMDSLEKVFKVQGYNTKHPELYAKIVKYNEILQEIKEIIPENNKTKNKFHKPLVLLATTIAAITGYKLFKKHQKNRNDRI